jgi:hypothetical protein
MSEETHESAQQWSRPGAQPPVRAACRELEGREVPTVNFIVAENTLFIAPSRTPSLTFTGERINIFDNGTNGANNVIAVGTSGRPFVPNVAITDIVVLGSRQADRVTYNLTGDLRGRRVVFVDLRNGNDRFDAFLRRNLVSGGSLNLTVRGSAGDDRITSTTVAQLASNSVLDVSLDGNAGNDSVRSLTTSFVGVAAGARFDANVTGGSGDDDIQATYQGQMNGSVGLFMDAGNGNDRVGANYALTRGSTGSMPPAVMLGGPGNDDLTMLITNLGTGLTINNFLDGGSGTNSCVRTTNVIAVDCQRDQVV